jgi:hypothetical protein
MGYIQRNLEDGERIVHQTKLHGVIFVLPLIFFAISFGGFLIASDILAEVFLGLSLIWVFWFIRVYFRSELAVTNRRVFGRTGFAYAPEYLEVSLIELRAAGFNPGILSKVFDYGTVEITDRRDVTHKFGFVSTEFYQHVQARRGTVRRVLG